MFLKLNARAIRIKTKLFIVDFDFKMFKDK